MAKPQRVTYFKVILEDKPGTLLAIMNDLKTKNLGLLALRSGTTYEGKAEVFVIPKSSEKVRSALRASGNLAEEGTVFFLKGTDRTGALVKSLQAIAHAGVNIKAIDAIAVGGRYGFFIWVAPGDTEKMTAVLGAK